MECYQRPRPPRTVLATVLMIPLVLVPVGLLTRAVTGLITGLIAGLLTGLLTRGRPLAILSTILLTGLTTLLARARTLFKRLFRVQIITVLLGRILIANVSLMTIRFSLGLSGIVTPNNVLTELNGNLSSMKPGGQTVLFGVIGGT